LKDSKRFFRSLIPESRFAGVDAVVDDLLDVLTSGWPRVLVRERVRIDGRADVLEQKLSARPWAHVKTFTSKEAADAFVASLRYTKN